LPVYFYLLPPAIQFSFVYYTFRPIFCTFFSLICCVTYCFVCPCFVLPFCK
jgi:hypothetical protein